MKRNVAFDETRVLRRGQLSFHGGLAELQLEPVFRNPFFPASCRESLVDLPVTTECNDAGDWSFGDLIRKNLRGGMEFEGKRVPLQSSQHPSVDFEGDLCPIIRRESEFSSTRPQGQVLFDASDDQS